MTERLGHITKRELTLGSLLQRFCLPKNSSIEAWNEYGKQFGLGSDLILDDLRLAFGELPSGNKADINNFNLAEALKVFERTTQIQSPAVGGVTLKAGSNIFMFDYCGNKIGFQDLLIITNGRMAFRGGLNYMRKQDYIPRVSLETDPLVPIAGDRIVGDKGDRFFKGFLEGYLSCIAAVAGDYSFCVPNTDLRVEARPASEWIKSLQGMNLDTLVDDSKYNEFNKGEWGYRQQMDNYKWGSRGAGDMTLGQVLARYIYFPIKHEIESFNKLMMVKIKDVALSNKDLAPPAFTMFAYSTWLLATAVAFNEYVDKPLRETLKLESEDMNQFRQK